MDVPTIPECVFAVKHDLPELGARPGDFVRVGHEGVQVVRFFETFAVSGTVAVAAAEGALVPTGGKD